MIITDDLINSLWFTTQISSGPNVIIYYDRMKDEFKATLHSVSDTDDYQIIFIYETMQHRMSEENLKSLIKNKINQFLAEHRNQKIDYILKQKS